MECAVPDGLTNFLLVFIRERRDYWVLVMIVVILIEIEIIKIIRNLMETIKPITFQVITY